MASFITDEHCREEILLLLRIPSLRRRPQARLLVLLLLLLTRGIAAILMFQDWQEQKAREQAVRRKARKGHAKPPPPPPMPEPENFARITWQAIPIRKDAAPDSTVVGELSIGSRVVVYERCTCADGVDLAHVALETEESDSRLSPYDRGWTSIKKSLPEMLGWVDCTTLLPVKEAARFGLRPSPEVAEWLEALSYERQAVERAWLTILDGQRFHVLRMHGTEPPNTGKFTNHFLPGVYQCAGCTTPLYSSDHKVDCDCGWASFCDELPGALVRLPGKVLAGKPDERKVEIRCAKCDGHIGHVFRGRADAPGGTGERHCVNSASVTFHGQTHRLRSCGAGIDPVAALAAAPPCGCAPDNPMAC